MLQTTLKKSVRCSGVGLHSGQKIELVLRPADPDTGVVFVRVQGQSREHLPLRPENVVSTSLATCIGNSRAEISTVEHLLSAVQGLGIDNLLIEVHGPEVPIMDGSAAPFVFLFRQAGLRIQDAGKRVFMLKKSVRFEQDGRWVKAGPSDRLRVRFTVDFPHPRVGRQTRALDVTPDLFVRQISRARTFGFLKDVEALQKNGLALGGSLENAVVLDEYDVLNAEGLRYNDEPVRHKILDFLGDMALLGHPVRGDFHVHCSGHALNNAFCRFLQDNEYLRLLTLGRGDGLPLQEPVSQPQAEPAWA